MLHHEHLKILGPTEAIGCISDVNELISKAGFPRKSTLPPMRLDFSKTKKSKQLEADEFEEVMSTKRSGKRRSRSKGEQPKDTNVRNVFVQSFAME